MINQVPPAPQEMSSLTDESILARVVGGDGAAFELLMRRHNQRLYRVARSVLHNDLEAEDVVQEAFVRAFTSLARFEGRSSVATWLTRIAFHEALRRRRRRRQAQRSAGAIPEARTASTEQSDGTGAASRRETSIMLTESLDTLPPELRSVVMLRLVQGLSTRETTECLRLSEASVRIRLHRGRRMLFEAVQRRVVPELSQQFTFGSQRCDRVVEAVFRRLGMAGQ